MRRAILILTAMITCYATALTRGVAPLAALLYAVGCGAGLAVAYAIFRRAR